MSRIVKAVFIISFLFPLVGFLSRAYAYEIEQLDAYDENNFELGPTSFEISARRGDSFVKPLQLTNKTGDEQEYLIYVRDFEGSDNPLQFTTIIEDGAGTYGASNWFDLEVYQIFLDHGERLHFEVQIDIPQTADAGEHYAMVLVEPVEQGVLQRGGSVVNVQSRVGSLFLIDVEGKREKRAFLDEFFTEDNFFEHSPIQLHIDVRNTGSVHVSPSGSIELYDILGRNVDVLEIENFTVLRDSIRRKSTTWERKFLIGRYTAKLSLDLDFGEDPVVEEISFWVIPWKFLLIVFSILIVAFVVIKKLLSKVKIEVKLK